MDFITGARMVRSGVPPVHREQVPAGTERQQAEAEHLIQVRVVEVIEDLGEHDEIEQPIGHSPGTTRCSTRTPGSPAVLDRADATAFGIASQASRLSQRDASAAVNTPIEQPGSNAVP